MAKCNIVVGIDIGLNGGIAKFHCDERFNVVKADCVPMPTIKRRSGKRNKKEIDEIRLIELLKSIARLDCNTYFYIEKQWARGTAFKRKIKKGNRFVNDGQSEDRDDIAMSAITEANIVGQYRFIRGVILTLGYNVYAVAPVTWQRRMFGRRTRGDSKKASIIIAQQLYPEISLLPTERSRKASDGMSDAVLITEYGRIICKTKIPPAK